MQTAVPIKARWGRLLSEDDVAEYLSLSRTTVRTLGLKCRRHGRRVLYDIKDVDGWVDRMGDQPPEADERAIAEERERFFARRRQRRG